MLYRAWPVEYNVVLEGRPTVFDFENYCHRCF